MILLLIDFGMDDLVITIVIAVIFIINLDALEEAGSRLPQIYILRYFTTLCELEYGPLEFKFRRENEILKERKFTS